jgi:hypothetical protein
MHPHPQTTRTPSSNDLYPALQYIQKHFYADHITNYQRDRRALLRALTWPAAWLDAQGLIITPKDYNQLLLRKLQQIQKHGDPTKYTYFPKYLMKALQDHCHHHRETIYLKLRKASYAMGQIADHIQTTPNDNHTQTLAAAHHLLRQKQRSHKTRESDQMTLGL